MIDHGTLTIGLTDILQQDIQTIIPSLEILAPPAISGTQSFPTQNDLSLANDLPVLI
jgi:hypothetical protein